MSADTHALRRLTQALGAYERAAALARFLESKEGHDLADQRWLALAFRAYVCGFRMAADETCLDWSRREVARFADRHPDHHASALAEAA